MVSRPYNQTNLYFNAGGKIRSERWKRAQTEVILQQFSLSLNTELA